MLNQTTRQGHTDYKSKVRINHPPDDIQFIRTSVHIFKKVIRMTGRLRYYSTGISATAGNNDIVGPISAENVMTKLGH